MASQPRDEQLWKLAKKRADFKTSLAFYIVINIFLWLIWFFTADKPEDLRGIPWPVWVMTGWGIGIIMQYFDAYGANKDSMAEKEYKKLKDRQNQ
jgi:hypothetical protein